MATESDLRKTKLRCSSSCPIAPRARTEPVKGALLYELLAVCWPLTVALWFQSLAQRCRPQRRTGPDKVVTVLVSSGCNVDIPDSDGHAPLMWAAALGHPRVVDLLLTKGADPNSRDSTGRTPLHWAAVLGQRDIVDLLLKRGASASRKDNDDKTPLAEATLVRNADFNSLLDASFHGITTMSYHSTARSDHEAVIELLKKSPP